MRTSSDKDLVAVIRVKNAVHSSSSIFLEGKYNVPGEGIVWLDNTGTKIHKGMPDPKKGEFPWDQNIKPLTGVIEIRKSRGDTFVKTMLKFYRDHPIVHVATNEDKDVVELNAPYSFILEVFDELDDREIEGVELWLKCVDAAREMNEAQRRKVLTFFSVPEAHKLDKRDLELALFNHENGIVRQESPNLNEFYDVFVQDMDAIKKAEVEMTTLIREALDLKIIDKSTGAHKLGALTMGTEEKDVVSYLVDHKDIAESLKVKVQQKTKTTAGNVDADGFSDAERQVIDNLLEEHEINTAADKTKKRYAALIAGMVEKGEKAPDRKELEQLAKAELA